MKFRNRQEAGRALAQALSAWGGRSDVLVLGLPRGGVPVAAEVARALGAPLDVLVVRKLGHPGYEDFAIGAIASGGVRVMSHSGGLWPVSEAALEEVIAREQAELARRELAYRGMREMRSLEGRVVILVDDGLATGATMRAAVLATRQLHASRIVVGVPIASRDALAVLATIADEVVSVYTPEPFHAVSLWYEDFAQTDDDEVRRLLGAA